MMNCWYTKSMKDETPLGKIHFCDDGGNYTYCLKKIDSPRWYIGDYNPANVNCLKCLKYLKENVYTKLLLKGQ